MKRIIVILILLAANNLFAQERNISAIFSGSYSQFPSFDSNDRMKISDNYALGFQAGLNIYNTVKLFGEIFFKDVFEEIEDSPVWEWKKSSIRFGLWNAMLGYKKHFNVLPRNTNVTNIELMYNITSFMKTDFGGVYFGFIYQKVNSDNPVYKSKTYEGNYEGYGVSVYMDTLSDSLFSDSTKKGSCIPWVKLGAAYTLGNGYYNEDLSYLVSLDTILGIAVIYRGLLPISLGLGYNGLIYLSDMVEGADPTAKGISRNEGFIINLTIKF